MTNEIKKENPAAVEKVIKGKSGGLMLLFSLALEIGSLLFFILSTSFNYFLRAYLGQVATYFFLIPALAVTAFIIAPILFCGLRVINPNEALVLTLFGKYYGTLKTPGFYWVNPFCSGINPVAKSSFQVKPAGTAAAGQGAAIVEDSPAGRGKKLSLKALTLNNGKQKINDELGNPIEIGVNVIWRITDTAKAVFNVDNFKEYLSIQCDSALRNIARSYPYDVSSGGDEKSLRGSSQEVALRLKEELQEKVDVAGIEILEARITHLAYAPEIAAAMLQRQQASAIIEARQMIVEGAVGMVEMALHKLSQQEIVSLDDERKAAMVSNLLVVLCGNRDAQPIVNSGSIY
ncbi:MAG: SPFH domain-containing protein [Peptococcaceae bacterium]|nr:SPFH domain-containing protein [Peptococcaceae bacterium]